MDPFMLEDTPLLFEVDGDHDNVKGFVGLFLNNNNREHDIAAHHCCFLYKLIQGRWRQGTEFGK